MLIWRCWLITAGISLCSLVYADEQITTLSVLPPQSQFAASQPYFYELLDAVMSRTEVAYGPYEISLVKTEITQARAVRELSQSRFLNVLWMGTDVERERELRVISVPLIRGLLGFRVPVIKAKDLERWQQIQTVDDLKSMVACQGESWPDSTILEMSGLKVERVSRFGQMYPMLSGGRCDYFPRGVHEVFSELEAAQQDFPELIAFTQLIIQYPFPMYFFVPPDRPDLQVRITEGLEQLLDEDWLSEYMLRHPLTAALADPALWQESRIIQLDNPILPLSADANNPRYWISPEAFLNSEW